MNTKAECKIILNNRNLDDEEQALVRDALVRIADVDAERKNAALELVALIDAPPKSRLDLFRERLAQDEADPEVSREEIAVAKKFLAELEAAYK